jgi:hypothetical protein
MVANDTEWRNGMVHYFGFSQPLSRTSISAISLVSFNVIEFYTQLLLFQFLRRFCKADWWLLSSSCLSACPSFLPSAWNNLLFFPPDGFSWEFYLRYLQLHVDAVRSRLNLDKEDSHSSWKPTRIYVIGLYNGSSLHCEVRNKKK